MNDLLEELEVGDPCFAHVRSYPWWPALVVDKAVRGSRPGKQFYQLVFFGTQENAWLPLKELVAISPMNYKKCVTAAALKRRHFKDGLDEMARVFKFS